MAEEVVQIEKLCSEESFQIWNFQLIVVLKANGLHGIVNGESPYESMATSEEKTAWQKKDAKAQKLIVMSIDKKWMMHIINCKTAEEMYKKLKNIFEKSTQDQVCSLLQQFYNFTFEKGCDMTIHIGKIENLAHRLKMLKQTIDDNMIISKILSTLPSHYKHFVTAWESTSVSERTLTNLTARLLAEEERGKEKESEPVAFKTEERFCYKCKNKNHQTKDCKKTSNKCFKCGKGGHYARDCTSKTKPACGICKKTNHLEKDCFFRKDKQKYDGKSEENRKVAFLIENEDIHDTRHDNIDHKFVVDSGSSIHMTNQKNLLCEIEAKTSNIMVAKKNESMRAQGRGKIESISCTLNNVLYVPELSKNLLSVNAITQNDGEVIFSKNEVIVMKDSKEILKGKKENGLYVIQLEGNQSFLVEKNEIKDWHRKLGHLGSAYMKKLIDMVEGINLKKKDMELVENCEICLKAKQTRIPFNTVRQRASRILEILHTDVCGPIDPVTWDGKRYILTIMDDYTHFSKIYLLKSKDEVPEYLKEFINESEASKNVKVSKIRCDNGGEYTQNAFKLWCKNKGIILDYSIPHTPQLNGRAERLNRTLLEKARALIFDSGLDKEMWGEAVYVATYLLNRSPTEHLDVSPAEKWTNQKPNLSHLQIFGSVAHAKVLGYLKKLDTRSKKYIFVGYAINGFRLWDEQTREIKIFRDVIFTEPEIKDVNLEVRLNVDGETEMSEGLDENEVSVSRNINDDETDLEVNSSKEETSIENGDQEQSESENNVKTSKSGRIIKTPANLRDYYYDLDGNEECALLTYEEALNGPHKEHWIQAIKDEKMSLNKNETWKLVNRSTTEGKKILTSKWVFRVKEDGRYKARLVIRGFEQEYGIDYRETYSPVVNMNCLRILFALAANKNLHLKTFDIKTAFLNGKLEEEIFMEVPQGYEENRNKVCLLQKSLYGLKQAPMNWNKHFTQWLTSKGLIALKTEHCIFKNKRNDLLLAIYVDDGILFGKDEYEIDNLLKQLHEEFEMSENKNPRSFLNIEFRKTSENIVLYQTKYLKTVLKNFGMENARSISTPIVENSKQEKEPENITSKQNYPYREIVGSLLYLTNKTRPDIQYAVNICSRKLENPTREDILNAKRLLRYLVNKENEGICFTKNSDCKNLIAFCDSDFAGDLNTRKSTTGFVIFYCGGPIAWTSRKQPIVSLSSTEAEYIAAADCTKELLYLKSVIEELVSDTITMELNIDNQSAIKLIKNGQFSKRSKHIDVRYHFVNEKVSEGILLLKYCETNSQTADIFTKPLNRGKFENFKKELMIQI